MSYKQHVLFFAPFGFTCGHPARSRIMLAFRLHLMRGLGGTIGRLHFTLVLFAFCIPWTLAYFVVLLN